MWGIGGSVSSDATRTDITDYTIDVKEAYVKKEKQFDPQNPEAIECKAAPGVWLDSDLHFDDWLESRLHPFLLNPDLKDVPPKTLTTEINFLVKATGSVNPSWKLIPTSFNTNALPLFAASRNDTSNILITISHSTADAQAAQNIQKIGSAVTTGLRPGLQ